MSAVRQGQGAIALVCVVLGIMLAVQFKTTSNIDTPIPYQRVEDLSSQLNQTEKERDALAKEVHQLRQEFASGVESKEMAAMKMAAGLAAVRGPGVVLTIDDSKRPSKPGENPNLYIIHDDDILKVINELFAAGAEAVSINEQRLIATSEIRCAGPTLSVNNVRSAPPYEIRALGDPKNLANALKMRGGVVETLQFWGIQINIKAHETLIIPAYKGAFHFEYAQPVTEEAR